MSKITDTWPHPLAKAAAEGCCGAPSDRGYLCQYHDGYAAAVDDTLGLVEEAILGTRPASTLRTIIEGGMDR